ncbi:acetyl-CoA hydrolase/transferase C-terminal domain-containing protein [Desulfosporosinus sp. PR]|uniref:acetyl-CoA hydrolase/transferase family protein n=1 Tax=Candidatus Desulfosporosinus nitrosoreducens TaxID=3401928 RepID=UPI0027F485A1|nr:acetyl-CoA hydrolase/transferase C-terminal domain-containing protein [Desulfosporosinus sp. PR]MDQ7095614.1 acetyl-CoA hydrolase/transferase C-terminal domain-containing protein [Desulfosporosinus sp. PR]
MSNWRENYQKKLATPEQAVKHIKSGDRVVIGHACGEPPSLIEALVNRAPELNSVEIVHMVAMGPAKYAQPGMEKSFRHNALFIGASTRQAFEEKRADFTPCFFSEIPRLFKNKILTVDVVLLQVTPPDEEGYCSLGISVDYTQPAAACAKLVIAQVNRHMPRTGGTKLHLDEIDVIVEKDEPLIELKPPKIGEIEKAIGENVAKLVPDGATLQLGIGAIPDAVLLFLKEKKDLGIHSEMFSDGVVALAEAGVITNSKKTINPGKFIATFLMGTRKLYDFVDNNPKVELHPVDYVNDPYIIGQHEAMISINSALQVDLMGQVNAEMIGAKQFSAVGGQVDYVRGASRSLNGKSIIALPSTASGGKISRITCELDRWAAVTTSRNDVHYVVTEYGAVDLRGKSLRARAEALISIAHPDFRAGLLAEARNRGVLAAQS